MNYDTAGRPIFSPPAFCSICGGTLDTAGNCVSDTVWSQMVHQRQQKRAAEPPEEQDGEGEE